METVTYTSDIEREAAISRANDRGLVLIEDAILLSGKHLVFGTREEYQAMEATKASRRTVLLERIRNALAEPDTLDQKSLLLAVAEYILREAEHG